MDQAAVQNLIATAIQNTNAAWETKFMALEQRLTPTMVMAEQSSIDISTLKSASDSSQTAAQLFESNAKAKFIALDAKADELKASIDKNTADGRELRILYDTSNDGVTEAKMQVSRNENQVIANEKVMKDAEARIMVQFNNLNIATAAFRDDINTRVSELGGSLSTAITQTQQSGSSGTGGAGKGGQGQGQRFTLDCDKRLQNVAPITGAEAAHDVIEWFERTGIKLESAVPGSKAVLAAVVKKRVAIEDTEIDELGDRFVAHRLNTEMFSWLSNVVTLRAWSFIKGIDSSKGLEAWRELHSKLTMKGPQQILAEHRYLRNPIHKPKSSQDMPAWI